MTNVYHACDWITQFDKLDVDLIFEKLNEYNCEMALLMGHEDNQGNRLLRLGVKTDSQSEFQKFVEDVGRRYAATSWYPISKYKFNEGKSILGDKESQDHVDDAIRSIIGDDARSYDLRQRLEMNEDNLQIYAIDWLIEHRTQPRLSDLFHTADAMEFPLAYAHVQDSQGFSYLRFFAIVTSFEIIKGFVDNIARAVGLIAWERVDKDRLPNILLFNPIKSMPANLLSKWSERIYASAIHNEKLARRNNKTT